VRVVRLVDRGAPLARPVDLQNVVKPGATNASMMNQPSSLVVKSGDSLWSIASQLVGSSATDEQIQQKLTEIWNMNATRIGTGDPNLLFAGQRLMLPS
jgi:Tfp pilus assembly protein FimV